MNTEELQLQWLWSEITRRFGSDEAADLKMAFEQRERRRDPQALQDYGVELEQFEEQLRALQDANEPETAYMHSLRWSIQYRRQLLDQME